MNAHERRATVRFRRSAANHHNHKAAMIRHAQKAADTKPPYSALWSTFRGCLSHNAAPINRNASDGFRRAS
jgi:hypothetical protein